MLYGIFQAPIFSREHMMAVRERALMAEHEKGAFADFNAEVADAYFNEGDFGHADSYLKKALLKNPQYLSAHMLEVRLLLEQGETAKALRILEALRAAHASYADILFLRAFALCFHGDMINALNEVRHALDINPQYLNARVLEIMLYQFSGRFDEFVQKSNRLLDDQRGAALTERLLQQGLGSYERRHYLSAVFNFHGAHALGHDKWLCQFNCACCYALLGRYEKARDILKVMLREEPSFRSQVAEDTDLEAFRHTRFFDGL